MSQWQRYQSIKELIDEVYSLEIPLLICVDAQVERLYSKYFIDLKSRDNVIWFTFPPGEKAKSFAEWERAIEFFLDRGVSRKSHLIAIGGGALSDVAGFVASTILRGISWSVIPTTLLSQVDASIGGKVAVNSKGGKNLIGNFHPPMKVMACSEFLTTLSKSELQSGKGEIMKYAFLNKEIYKHIIENKKLNDVVDLCANYKLELVKRDLNEKGERKLLNLGHTFGHGIEWVYKIAHGEAVVWGIALSLIVENQELLLREWKLIANKLELEILKSPWSSKKWQAEDVISVASKDKKNITNSEVEFIVAKKIGTVVIEKRLWSNLEKTINDQRDKILALSIN